ncbi:MAG: PqqD family protein [Clostridia bacterium]|nr:PqqD family protein [Clostridia bacterium]
MKLKKGFVLKKTAGRYVAVSMGDDYNGFMGMVTLSGTAPFYWELLKSEQTLDSLAESVTKEYDVTKEEAIKDLKPFIKKLLDAGILEE